jgi:uncharacterized repeat protein (TIGR01451 family)
LFRFARGRVALAAACSAMALLASASPAMAAGSSNLWPNGASGSRANTEWRTGSYGNGALIRRTLIKAYMTAGQVLMLGSTAIGQGSSDILVYNPNLVTGSIGTETIPAVANFSCNAQRLGGGAPPAQGIIASRAEELAGPDTIPTGGVAGGYVPCHYTAPSTGIYDIAFLGPLGAASNADGAVAADVALAAAGDFDATQGTSIAGWDATVRANLTSTVNITGRVFTYYLALFTAGNGLPVFPSIYAVTRDAYRYKIDLRGMDPNGWVVYGNQVGFLDSDGTTPLYHDAVADATGSPGQLTGIQGGVSIARPTFPLFFEPPAAATIAALRIPATPIAPIMSAISFAGTVGGNTSLVNSGGTFKFTTNVPGVYDIVVSRGVDFDPTNPLNRSLRGVVNAAGIHTATWDGLDNSNTAFPVGAYQAHVTLHGGEYHFPMIDVENDTTGGPTITMLNAPGGVCPPLTGGCSGAFYDDRAYMTRNGTVVDSGNTVGTVLCGTTPPATAFSNTISGFNSAGAQRAFGAASGGNNNVPCTGNFGDAKGLDIWTYNQSNTVLAPLVIVAAAADIRVRKSVSNATPAVGANVTFTIAATDLGPNNATGVQVRDVLPAGLAFVSATPSAGTTWASGTGVWNIGNLAVGATATLRIVATVTGASKVTNVASRLAGTPPDFNPANNTARAAVTGSTVPGLPNTGTPPLGSWWPALLALVLVFAIIPWPARRHKSRDEGQAGS